MARVEILGREEILGGAFVGQDDRLMAREGGRSERAAMARRVRAPAPTSSGFNSHLAYVRGLRPSADYPALVAAAKRAKKITEPQLEAIAQAMFKTIQPSAADQATLRKILRENLVRGGVTVVQGEDDIGARRRRSKKPRRSLSPQDTEALNEFRRATRHWNGKSIRSDSALRRFMQDIEPLANAGNRYAQFELSKCERKLRIPESQR